MKKVLVVVSCASLLVSCARSPKASAGASSTAIKSEDEICSLLTAEEVSAELKQPVTPRRLPTAGQYGAPKCGWLTSDAPDAAGFVLTLFFYPDSADGPKNFTEKIKHVCITDAPKELEGLGDEAAICRKLLVRKGNVFFMLDRQKGEPSVPWADAAQRLAQKAVSRLP